MTVQEFEILIDEAIRDFKIALLKGFLIAVLGGIILCLLAPFLEKMWEDFRYWLDCKKWDREHKDNK